MKKVIALSIGLAFSVGSIAQEQVQSMNTMEKTHSVVKGIVKLVKDNNAAATSLTTVEVKPSEPVKAEEAVVAKTDTKVEDVKITEKVDSSKSEAKPAVEPIKTEVKADTKKEEAPVAKAEIKKEEVTPVVKNTVKKATKVKIKAKKKVVKKKESKNLTFGEPNAVLLKADYYYIPKYATADQYELFARPITYNDVDVVATKNDNNINLSLVDKRINKPLDKLYLENQNVTILNTSTDLEEKETLEFKYNDKDVEFSLGKVNKCVAIFAEYKLNNQPAKSFVKFVDDNGNMVDNLPASCKKDISDSKDTAFFTENENIINISLGNKQSSLKGFSMKVHFTRDGHEFVPTNMKAFAIAKDFSSFSTLDYKPNEKGPFFGIDVSQKLAPNSYYIILNHQFGQKVEWVKTNTLVQ